VPGFDPARLRTARAAAGLSQQALAEAVDVHVNTVVEWEAGRQVPRVDTVAALAQALHVTPPDLLAPIEGSTPTLQQLRTAVGKTQQQVADEADLLRTTYVKIELGATGSLAETDPAALGAALGVSDEQIRAAHSASRTAYLERHPRSGVPGRRRRRDS
jgi:transcriptional regulator with XRE-family HTH domain